MLHIGIPTSGWSALFRLQRMHCWFRPVSTFKALICVSMIACMKVLTLACPYSHCVWMGTCIGKVRANVHACLCLCTPVLMVSLSFYIFIEEFQAVCSLQCHMAAVSRVCDILGVCPWTHHIWSSSPLITSNTIFHCGTGGTGKHNGC
jgi:hypothetical protein